MSPELNMSTQVVDAALSSRNPPSSSSKSPSNPNPCLHIAQACLLPQLAHLYMLSDAAAPSRLPSNDGRRAPLEPRATPSRTPAMSPLVQLLAAHAVGPTASASSLLP